jgi:hypothetical protein
MLRVHAFVYRFSELNASHFPHAKSDNLQIATVESNGLSQKLLKLGDKGGTVDSDGRPLALATSITATKQNKTTQTQTAQAAGLIGQWKYDCRVAKGHSNYWQLKTLDFNGDKLKTDITFYLNTPSKCANNSRIYKSVTGLI